MIKTREEGANFGSAYPGSCQFDQRAITKAANHLANSNNKAGNLLVEDRTYILESVDVFSTASVTTTESTVSTICQLYCVYFDFRSCK
jgi:hypothetical protein